MIKKTVSRYKNELIWAGFILSSFLFLLWRNTHEGLWFDESFTAMVVKRSFADIIRICGEDVHPPLYYFLLKIFQIIFGVSIFTMRAFSALGAVLWISLGAGPVRRILGNRSGWIFSILLLMLPMTIMYAQEARMYIWCGYFATGAFLYGYLSIKEGKLRDWIIFGLLSFCASYTHYFALLTAISIYLVFFIWIIINDRAKIKYFLITATVVALLWLPWLFYFLTQAARVSKDYWIEPLNIWIFLAVLAFPCCYKTVWPMGLSCFIALGLSLCLLISSIYYSIRKKDSEKALAVSAFLVYLLTLGLAIAASYLIKPVLMPRYMIPAIGVLLVAMTWGIGQIRFRFAPGIILGIMIIIFIPQYIAIETKRFNGPGPEVIEYIRSNMKKDDIFIHNNEHTAGIFSYHFPDNKHMFFVKKGFSVYSNFKVFEPAVTTGPDLAKFIDGHKEMWFSSVDIYWIKDRGKISQPDAYDYFHIIGDMKTFTEDHSWFYMEVSRVKPNYKKIQTLKPN